MNRLLCFRRGSEPQKPVLGNRSAVAAFGLAHLHKKPPCTLRIELQLTPRVTRDPDCYPGEEASIKDHVDYLLWYYVLGKDLVKALSHTGIDDGLQPSDRKHLDLFRMDLGAAVALLGEHHRALAIESRSDVSAVSDKLKAEHQFWLFFRYQELFPNLPQVRRITEYTVCRAVAPWFRWEVNFRWRELVKVQLRELWVNRPTLGKANVQTFVRTHSFGSAAPPTLTKIGWFEELVFSPDQDGLEEDAVWLEQIRGVMRRRSDLAVPRRALPSLPPSEEEPAEENHFYVDMSQQRPDVLGRRSAPLASPEDSRVPEGNDYESVNSKLRGNRAVAETHC